MVTYERSDTGRILASGRTLVGCSLFHCDTPHPAPPRHRGRLHCARKGASWTQKPVRYTHKVGTNLLIYAGTIDIELIRLTV